MTDIDTTAAPAGTADVFDSVTAARAAFRAVSEAFAPAVAAVAAVAETLRGPEYRAVAARRRCPRDEMRLTLRQRAALVLRAWMLAALVGVPLPELHRVRSAVLASLSAWPESSDYQPDTGPVAARATARELVAAPSAPPLRGLAAAA